MFFRARTKAEAERLGVNGWVRNLPDGTVEAVFEAAPDKVQTILDYCAAGPGRAIIDHIEEYPEVPEGLIGFYVR